MPSTTTAGSKAGHSCQSSELRADVAGPEGEAGSQYCSYALRHTSPGACSTLGYVTLPAPARTADRSGQDDPHLTAAPGFLVLHSRHGATFSVRVSWLSCTQPAGGHGCKAESGVPS